MFLVGATAQGTSPQTYTSASNYILGSGQFTTEAGINVISDASLYFTNGGDIYTNSSGALFLTGEGGIYANALGGNTTIKSSDGDVILQGYTYVRADAESISLNAGDGDFSVYSEGDTRLTSNAGTYISTGDLEVSCSSFLVNNSPVVTEATLNAIEVKFYKETRVYANGSAAG